MGNFRDELRLWFEDYGPELNEISVQKPSHRHVQQGNLQQYRGFQSAINLHSRDRESQQPKSRRKSHMLPRQVANQQRAPN